MIAKILLGVPLILSILGVLYGILFAPAVAGGALVAVATLGICNMAYYLSPVHH